MEIVVVLLAALLIYALQRTVYKKFWDHGLHLSLRYERNTAFEGDQTALLEVLSNHKLLPLPWVNVKFQVHRSLDFTDSSNAQITDYYYRNDLFSIATRQRITRRLPFRCTKRGFYTIHGADMVSSDLLGLQTLAKSTACATQLTVYPVFADSVPLSIPYKRINGSLIRRSVITPDPFAFRGIREYQPTDSMRSINFKASARTGSLMSNVYDPSFSQELVLILNIEKYKEWQHDDLYEYAIRIAATLSDMALRDGVPIRFYTNGRDIVTTDELTCSTGSGDAQFIRILEALARIDLKQPVRCKSHRILQEALEEGRHEPIYILISPYFMPDLQEAYADFAARAFDSLWLIPYDRNEPEATALANETILPCEVIL